MPDPADIYVPVKVIVHRILPVGVTEDFRLEIDPTLIKVSPEVEGESPETVGVKWTLGVSPLNDFPYIASLMVSFKGSRTPFSEISYSSETFTAHATATTVSNNSGQDVLSGPVLNGAVAQTPDGAITAYDYTITVSVRREDNSAVVPDIVVDPVVLVKRKKLPRDPARWRDY